MTMQQPLAPWGNTPIRRAAILLAVSLPTADITDLCADLRAAGQRFGLADLALAVANANAAILAAMGDDEPSCPHCGAEIEWQWHPGQHGYGSSVVSEPDYRVAVCPQCGWEYEDGEYEERG